MNNVGVGPRDIFIIGEIDEHILKEFHERFFSMIEIDNRNEKMYKKYKRKPINVYIDTCGGDLYSALSIYDILRASKTPINTICTGKAMSAGSVIFLAGKKRLVSKHATILIHSIISGCHGPTKDVLDHAEDLKRMQKQLEEIYIDRTNISKDKLRKIKNKKEDFIVDAKEAIKLEIATDYYK